MLITEVYLPFQSISVGIIFKFLLLHKYSTTKTVIGLSLNNLRTCVVIAKT